MPILLTPSQIAQNYLTYLSNANPNINVAQQDTDWWIRAQVVGGVAAGVYADNLLISNDAFPQSARHEALAQFLQEYFGNDPIQGNFLPATNAEGFAYVTGQPGQVVLIPLQATYTPNGNTYQVSVNTELDAISGTGLVPFISVTTGQGQNLSAGTSLTISSPPAGLQPTIIVASGGFSDAKEPETDDEARARILAQIQNGFGVGRVVDYEALAKKADPSVVSVSVARFILGLGTVGIYITAGTSDIDKALDNGEVISVFPSQILIDEVQAYLDINSPITDMVYVMSPVALNVDVTVQAKFSQGDASTTLSGQTLTQGQLVAREVERAIYKTPPGGRKIGNSGFLVMSDIEQTIDVALSAEPFEVGTMGILLDRQILPLSASGNNLGMAANQVAIPRTITVVAV